MDYIDLMAESYEVGSRGAREEDIGQLEDALTLLQEGTALIGASTDSLQPCG